MKREKRFKRERKIRFKFIFASVNSITEIYHENNDKDYITGQYYVTTDDFFFSPSGTSEHVIVRVTELNREERQRRKMEIFFKAS